jgi:multidrug efflux pump subunit AcrA (membrane-fusion protein)
MPSSSPNNTKKVKALWRFWPWLILLVAVVFAVLLIATREQRPAVKAQEKRFLIESQLIEFFDYSPEISLFGSISIQATSTLNAPLTAEVMAIAVRNGDSVKVGQRLLELDRTDIDFVVGQRAAEVAQLRAELQNEKNRLITLGNTLKSQEILLNLADKERARLRQLQSQKLSADSQVDAGERSYEQQKLILEDTRLALKNQPQIIDRLQAQLRRAELALAQAENDQAKATLRAPFDGVVTGVLVGVGSRVQAGSPLLALYAKENLEISALIPENHLARVRQALAAGEKLVAYAPKISSEKTFLLKRLSAEVSSGSGGILAFFALAPDDAFALGETLSLRLRLPPVASVRLPASALYQQRFVYRLTAENRLERVVVTLLGEQQSPNGQSLVLLQSAELRPGDRVMTTTLPNAINGLQVEWQSPNTKTKAGQS